MSKSRESIGSDSVGVPHVIVVVVNTPLMDAVEIRSMIALRLRRAGRVSHHKSVIVSILCGLKMAGRSLSLGL